MAASQVAAGGPDGTQAKVIRRQTPALKEEKKWDTLRREESVAPQLEPAGPLGELR
eukprot:CAMPEP_0206136224 /NCGR_PEP_ID=MMETSP1473-20131121/1465_1 /ASSEMBLY_ACC=CAM_ASM_001109 /TAXON_ID=1461547 /ORGANISM="Stichococcus sp, Strain RCC1054" /LENGTH=55 /DNA_ID=CAMNT_0053528595 /DNA_START=62 /DNA_END=225 /DNA_ORIENTATION=+